MTDESKRTPRAVIWSALLHVGLAGFLFATTLSCTSWEHVFTTLDLPASWNPMMCERPQALAGPVIEATLVGPAAAPLPKIKITSVKAAPPPPPKPDKPIVAPEKITLPPVKTLPPPPKNPDTHDQQKVVAVAQAKAEQAKRVEQQKEKQRMSELAAARQAKLDKIFKQMDQLNKQQQHADSTSRLDQQKLAQLKDLKKADQQADDRPPGLKVADKAQSGGNGTATDAYKAAIQNAVTQAWLRPDNIPEGAACPIHIVQIPGGQVISVTVEPSCPFDAAGRRSVKDAVMRAAPLPYKGFEKSFRSDLTLNFKVEN